MRLRRLDLIRYGHFTDISFELPARKFDFHIVFGPNEAGKSTALNAIEDLLFGIPTRSPYNFLHDFRSMRIGAEIENGNSSLEVLRRKGRRDTLLSSDDLPIAGGEGVLRPYLAGVDRSFFERMFSLDHVRLRTGGQEILSAGDDVGQMLFSAGAGIMGLRGRIDKLSDEAKALWTKRRAGQRKFYIAYDKFTEAKKKLKEQTLPVGTWRERKRAYERAEEAYAVVDEKIKETSAEHYHLIRIRRVLRDVRRKQELEDELAELGDVVALPEDASDVLAEAERKVAETATRIATLQDQLKRARKHLEELTFDEVLIRRSEDVDQLRERRIEVRGERADLPKRKAELKAAEAELLAIASELEWRETDSAALIARIPSRSKVSRVRFLLNEGGKLEAKVTSHARLLQEAQETHRELEEELAQTSEPADVSRLAIVIRTLREQGDLSGRVRNAESALKVKQGVVRRTLGVLKPGGNDEETLAHMTVPVLARVQDYRQRKQDWERRLREKAERVRSIQESLETLVASLDRSVQNEQVITSEELLDARSHRDALWQLVKVVHVRGEPPQDQASGFEEELENLPDAFESAITRADEYSDWRFDHAETAGRIAEAKRQIETQQIVVRKEQESEAELIEEGEKLRAEWSSMWAEAPFDPLDADSMLEWLKVRDKVLENVQEREEAQINLATQRKAEREARQQVLRELADLGIDVSVLENDGLNFIVERAREKQRLGEAEARMRAQLAEDVVGAAKESARREREFQEAQKDQDEWGTNWMYSLVELGLADSTAPELVGPQMDILDQMRGTADRIRSLQHERIDKIIRDIDDFKQAVSDLTRDLAADLQDQPAEDAVLELENRLHNSRQVQGLWERKNEEVEDLRVQIEDCENVRREQADSMSHLMTIAATHTCEALKEAIERSDRQRSNEDERRTIIRKLNQDGDGKSIEELAKECEGVAIDKVTAREVSIQADLDDLQMQRTNAAEERIRARDAFQAVGGEDSAARAGAEKQEALAELQKIAERYVRVRTAAILLRWAMDRYRREKQAPLLKRAGELFKIITGGSFLRFQVEYDTQDNAQLVGVRLDESIVPVSGMSTGTTDQLYLALRVASIEDYLARAEALPFIADDLFVNFDDARAAAGFRLLGELSRRTQVVFFTHHQHLVDIAQRSLGVPANTVTLATGAVALDSVRESFTG